MVGIRGLGATRSVAVSALDADARFGVHVNGDRRLTAQPVDEVAAGQFASPAITEVVTDGGSGRRADKVGKKGK